MHSGSLRFISVAHTLLDSSLHLVSVSHGLSRIQVIIAGLEDEFTTKYSGWMNSGNADSMVALLPGFNDRDRTEGRLLIGAWYAFQPGTANYRKVIFSRQ